MWECLCFSAVSRAISHFSAGPIYKQIRSTDEATNSLKTTNAYRILPIPTELDEMLSKRKAKLSEGGKDISLWPIVSQDDGTGISMPCKRRYFANYCKEQLRLAKVKEEVVLEMDYEAKRHPEEEADATSYLIRRNLATAIQSECSFDYDEKQYVMGHAIDTPNERRRDFVNPDLLYEIWMKFNQRSLHRKYSDFFTADIGTLRIHQKSAEVTITDECIRKHGGSVLINIYNSDVNDKIDIKVKKLETAPHANFARAV